MTQPDIIEKLAQTIDLFIASDQSSEDFILKMREVLKKDPIFVNYSAKAVDDFIYDLLIDLSRE